MADNGATEAQLMAVFGWTDAKMATHYTRTANRRRLAAESIGKLDENGTKCPAPLSPLPRPCETYRDNNNLTLEWCGREESNLHERSSQRPQRCASTISATTAIF
jgi:hypothetical protein